jgi:hypothetical protein
MAEHSLVEGHNDRTQKGLGQEHQYMVGFAAHQRMVELVVHQRMVELVVHHSQ